MRILHPHTSFFTPQPHPRYLESPSPLAIASDAPVSELSAPFGSDLQTHHLPSCFANCRISPKHLIGNSLENIIFRYFHEDTHMLIFSSIFETKSTSATVLDQRATKFKYIEIACYKKVCYNIQLSHVKWGRKYARKK